MRWVYLLSAPVIAPGTSEVDALGRFGLQVIVVYYYHLLLCSSSSSSSSLLLRFYSVQALHSWLQLCPSWHLHLVTIQIRIHGHKDCWAQLTLLRHVRLHVLLEMITTTELLAAGTARIWPETGMDALVPCQLLVAGEGFAAGLDVAFEGSFAWKSR